MVQLSPDGSIDLYVSAPVHVLIDVAGIFAEVAGPTSAGRFVPLPPARLVDTRSTGAPVAGDLAVALPAGVGRDAIAVAISVTVTDPVAPVYVTVHPAGSPRPTSSIVNSEPLERARTVTVLAPVTANGLIVYRSAPANVVIDVIGWFTGPSAPAATDGLFVVQSPTRVWDSRTTSDPLHAGGTSERVLSAQPAAAALVNVTAIDATAPGYISAFAAGTPQPYVSMLNVAWRDPMASMSIVATSTRGAAFHGSAGMHVLVDVAGVLHGSVGCGHAAAAGERDADHRWVGADGVGLLDGRHSLERADRVAAGGAASPQISNPVGGSSARRVADGRAMPPRLRPTRSQRRPAPSTWSWSLPATTISARRSRRRSTGWSAAARARGIPRIVWLTYREPVGYQSPSEASNAANYVTYNALLRSKVASGAYPDVVLADWNAYTASRPEWFHSDGVHVDVPGAWAAGTYVSRTLAFLDRRPCPTGLGGPVAPGGWCASPDVTGPPA